MLSPELLKQVGQSPTLVSGRLHILNLDRLEQHFGTHWPRVKSRALAIAEQTILSGLGPTDLHIHVEETKWLFFFPSLDKEAAQLRCAMVAEKVFRRLIGDDARFDDVRIETVVVETDGKLLLQATDPIALVQAQLRQAEARPAAPAGAPASDHFAWDFDDDEASLQQPPAKPAAAPQQWLRREPETFPTDISFQFQPIWDAGRELLAVHFCEPVRVAPGGVPLTGYETLTTGNDSPLVGDLDLATFLRARGAVRDLIRAGDPCIIGYPVHCRTLDMTAARERLTKALERAKPDERKLFSALLAGLPRGAPAHRILQGISFLRRYARAVFIGFPLDHTHFEPLAGSGAYGAVFRYDHVGAPPMRDIERFQRFAEQAHRFGLKPVALGMRDARAVAAAIKAGIAVLQGKVIGRATERPSGVRSLSAAHLLRAATSEPSGPAAAQR